MLIDNRIHEITAHDASVGSNPELSHTTFHVQTIVNHHQSVTACTIHNSPPCESLLLPILSTDECIMHATILVGNHKQLMNGMCMNAENEERARIT